MPKRMPVNMRAVLPAVAVRAVLPSLAALLVAPVVGAGCIIVADDFELPQPDFDPEFEFEGELGEEYEYGNTPARGGRVNGDIGPVRNFDGENDDVNATAQDGWSSIVVETYDEEGRMGMIIVDIERDIRDVPSGTYSFSADGTSDMGSYVYVTGCSSTWDNEYDAPASDGVIIVDNDGDECDVDVEASLPDADASGTEVTTTAYASFTLEL